MAKIIIIGGGFGGIRAALDLEKKLSDDQQISLISASPTHCYLADLFQVITTNTSIKTKKDFINLESSVNIPLKKIFQNKKINLIIDSVLEIDLKNRQLSTTSNFKHEFDYLVIAIGSKTNYFQIPGAEQFSHPFKTASDALNIRNDLIEHIENKNELFKITIVGGGFTGVELAGTLIHFLNSFKKNFKFKIILVESTDNLLPGMPDWAKNEALNKLKQLGVEIYLNFPVTKVTTSLIYSHEKELDYNYLIWSGGIEGNIINQQIPDIQLSNNHCIKTTADLSVENFPDVFVVGDLAEITDTNNKKLFTATAREAIHQGKIVAKNIVLKSKGHKTIAYHPLQPVFVVPIGKLFALSNFANLKIVGFFGFVLKRLVALKYFLSILPVFDAFGLWRKVVKIILYE